MIPYLESLECRLAPAGIPLPNLVHVDVPAQFSDTIDQIANYVKFGIFTGGIPYAGLDTILVLMLAPGHNGPGVSNGKPTTFHSAIVGPLIGEIPILGISGNLTPAQAAPGIRFDLARLQQGNFFTDNLSPGPDAPRAPNFLLTDYLFLLLLQQAG